MYIKPSFKAFVIFSSIKLFISIFLYTIILEIILFIFLRPNLIILLGILLFSILISLIYLISKIIKFNKEKYNITNDRVKIEYGGIFTSNKSELINKNIIKVSLTLPFFEYKLFKTGSIEISSSSTSSLTRLKLNSIVNPQIIYETLQQNSIGNGKALLKSKLIQKDKPNIIGITLDLLYISLFRVLGIILSIYYILSSQITTDLGENQLVTYVFSALILSSILFSSIKFIFGIIIKFFDIYKREYKLFNNYVYFHDGFLDKNFHFIPIKNISDTSTKQNIIQNILGISNVIASGKGPNNEIVFEQMNNGNEFETNLSNLIKENEEIIINNNSKANDTKKLNSTKYYKQDIPRAIAGFATTIPFFIILPIFFYMIKELFKSFVTKYYITSNTIVEEFKFLQTQKYKFNIDKITSFVITKNLLDKIFNTYTLRFTSFGSSRRIEFKNIDKYSDALLKTKSILEIDNSNNPLNSFITKPDIYSFLIKNLNIIYTTIILVLTFLSYSLLSDQKLLVIPALIFTVLLLAFLVINWFSIKSQKVSFYDNYLLFEKGIIFSEKSYIWYEDIKDIKSKKYPLTNVGDLYFSIAGGQGINEEDQANSFSNHLVIKLTPEIQIQHDILDNILLNDKFTNIPIKEDISTILKPHLFNSIFIFIIIPFLWIFLPFVLIKFIFTSYIISDKRISQLSGLIFKYKKTVLAKKIDFIDTHVLLPNRIFRTGNIVINTAGSLIPEITLQNIGEFERISAELKQKYN